MRNKTGSFKYVSYEILPVKYKEKKPYLRSVSIMRKAKGMSTEDLFPLPFSLATSVDVQLLYIVPINSSFPFSRDIRVEHFSSNHPNY